QVRNRKFPLPPPRTSDNYWISQHFLVDRPGGPTYVRVGGEPHAPANDPRGRPSSAGSAAAGLRTRPAGLDPGRSHRPASTGRGACTPSMGGVRGTGTAWRLAPRGRGQHHRRLRQQRARQEGNPVGLPLPNNKGFQGISTCTLHVTDGKRKSIAGVGAPT